MKNRVELDVTAATVNEITAQYPKTICVFNDFGVDACCGGDANLAEAAVRDGVNLEAVAAALNSIIADDDGRARR